VHGSAGGERFTRFLSRKRKKVRRAAVMTTMGMGMYMAILAPIERDEEERVLGG
jgi:hypothetical protein